jgi:hypothetical protein
MLLVGYAVADDWDLNTVIYRMKNEGIRNMEKDKKCHY